MYQARDCGQISIHALREEGDLMVAMSMSGGQSFLSTPSARRATIMQGLNLIQGKNISIHALREEGDYAAREQFRHITNFYPRPPRGGRPPLIRYLIIA